MLSLLAVSSNLVMPAQASSYAAEVDWLMWFNFWVCIFFGALIFVGCGYLGWRYRHKPGVNDMGRGPTHSNLLEIVWSVIPLIIVLLIAVWGFQGYMKMAVLPPSNSEDTLEITVEAYKWGWRFIYPNGYSEPTLHVPKDVNIRLVERSQDVIHSLYLPQMRYKKDAVPGRFNKGWFRATEESPMGYDLSKPIAGKDGEYQTLSWTDPKSYDIDQMMVEKGDAQTMEKQRSGFEIYCTEYCGTGHSRMISRVYVHPTMESYKQWLAIASNIYNGDPPAVEVGKRLVALNGCNQCHSVDGARGTGPTWKDMYGHPVRLADGRTLDVDENYLRDSILYPQKEIVETYGGAMPSYLGKFSDRDLAAIITYMKSISTGFKGNPAELSAPTPKLNEDKNKTK